MPLRERNDVQRLNPASPDEAGILSALATIMG
jgi:hypothetical protein